jgi:hypothetical protein
MRAQKIPIYISRRQSRNRARVDVVAAGDVTKRFAPVAAANRLAPLVRGELEWSAQALPPCLRPRAAFASAGADQFSLELRQSAEHGQHQTPVRRGCVGPRVREGSKPGFLSGDPRESVEKIAGRARQAVEPRHHHHVAGVDLGQQPAKLRPLGLGSARHFPEYLFRSAARSWRTCAASLCPSVDTRAYP